MTMHTTRALTALATLATTAVLVAPGPVSAHGGAAPTTELRPGQVERGADIAVPHLEDGDLVDGDVRFALDTFGAELLGTSGDDYVVTTWPEDAGMDAEVRRYAADGSWTVLLEHQPYAQVSLSQDGAQLVQVRYRSRAVETRVVARSAEDGTRQAVTTVRGDAFALDADGGLVLLGAWSPQRTLWWDTTTGATDRVNGLVGYEADIRADRIASFDRDPYDDGCSVTSTLTDPATPLWTSCRDRVEAFSETGRMATVPILSDGLGATSVTVRGPAGHRVATWTARWFGDLVWETDQALLLDTHGREQAAVVRAEGTTVTRASDLRPTADPTP
jgi:hypothetical protein